MLTGALNDYQDKKGSVYRSLVASLFEDVRILALGVVSTVFAILITAYKLNSLPLYTLAGTVACFGIIRVLITLAYMETIKTVELDDLASRKWEIRFTIGAVFHAILFGVWFFLSSWHGDPMAQLLSLAVLFGNFIGVCSRSYPFPQLVILQLMSALIPLIAGLYITGGYYNFIGILLIPYMLGMRRIASVLRTRLLRNILQRLKAEQSAAQLDLAINNMPHGICMFDSSGMLEMTNGHLSRFMGRSEKSLLGSSVHHILSCLVSECGVSPEDGAVLKNCVSNGSRKNTTHVFELAGKLKRTVKFRSNRSAGDNLVITFEDITRDVIAASKIDYMTRFDKLTGLLNRGQFTLLLEQRLNSIQSDNCSAVLLVNMHRFKQINETHGHRFGDLLLVAATKRLKKIGGKIGICARYAGDEFAIVINGDNSLDIATSMADVITDNFQTPFEIEGELVQMGCCVGISDIWNEKNKVESLLKHADLALDWAKREGCDEWRVFNDDLLKELVERRELEHDLKRALKGNQLEAYFQPLVSIKEKQVSSCEALVRWKHPNLGFVPPDRFIPLAEECGMVVEIGAWMLMESCMACASWPQKTQVAVNLSPIQFKDGDIVKTICNALEHSGLEPNRLQLEITESLMMDDMRGTIAKLNELKKMGVLIALDDFGTGYSSLSYMNNLPLDKVKIDRSFITGLKPNSKSLTLVQAIAGLGHQLGLCVVVEGVETDAELKVLLDNADIDEIQGYLFSRPVDKIEIMKLLNTQKVANHKMLLPLTSLDSKAA